MSFSHQHLIISINRTNITNTPPCSFRSDIGGGGESNAEDKAKLEELERQRLEALKEAEDKRNEKHRKLVRLFLVSNECSDLFPVEAFLLMRVSFVHHTNLMSLNF